MNLAYLCLDVQGSALVAERCKHCKRTYTPRVALQGFCSTRCAVEYIRINAKGEKTNVAK